MNYFGHALVAAWHDPASPGLALGAMLPDLQSMSGARAATIDDAEVRAGVALHHRTDAAFHRLAPFVGLTRQLEARLAAAGVTRGPRRAVGHVGVELLLDGVLVAEPAGRIAYQAALAHPVEAITWRDEGDAARFAWLHDRLRAHGVPDDLARPAAVAARLRRMLAPRPRLRPSGAEAEAIERELAAIAPRVRVAAPTILGALRAALAAGS
jgi:hypothetical protein